MIRVVLADDHQVVREGIQRILADLEDVCVVGQAGDGDALLAFLRETPCDVVVLDLGLPGRSGMDVLKTIRAAGSKVKVLVFSMQPEDQYAIRILEAGAHGYLTKGRSPDELIHAIRAIAAGGRYLTPQLADLLMSHRDARSEAPHGVLTDRELDILTMLCRGRRPSDVATDLSLSPSTVSTHIGRMKKKLGVSSLGELIRYAMKSGIE